MFQPRGWKGRPLKVEDPKPTMIARSNPLCPRFLRFSLAYGKPLPCRQRVAVFSSKSGNHTILENISQSPASTCWSLLSPSSSIIVRFIKNTHLTSSCLGENGIFLISTGVKHSVLETPKTQINTRENATRCVACNSSSYSIIG